MKSAVETLNPTRVRLSVEVPYDELAPSLEAAYKKIGAQVQIPGFRKGRVPPRLIDQRFGRGVVLEEAVNDALPRFYSQALQENSVRVMGTPEVDVTEVPDPQAGGELKFTAEVDVVPEIELPDLSELEVAVDDVAVSDEDVEQHLQSLRERFGTLRGVDRAAAAGDFVSLDLAAALDGEDLADATAKGLSYQVGGGAILPGLDEAVTGLSRGDTTTFETTLAGGEHAGREAQVTVTVGQVKERELPALDDDFAQTASEFDTVAELRDDARSQLERSKRMSQAAAARDKVLEALLAKVDVPLPEAAVKAEVEQRLHGVEHELQNAGMTKQEYLASEEQSEEDFDHEIEERVRESIKAQLILDKIAEREQFGVSEQELSDHLVRHAMRMGVEPQQLANQIVENGQVPELVSEVVRGKALAFVLDQVRIVDASGRQVDLEALRPRAADNGGDGEPEGSDEAAPEHDAPVS